MCVRHIYGNLKKKHGSKSDMKPYIWSLAWSYNEAEFQQNLDRIFNYDSEVYDDVQKMKPRTWCRAFYKIGSCCEDVENNSTESFNSTITKAREKPFVPMLETVRRLAMAHIAKRSDISRGHKGKIMFCFLFFMFSCSGFIFSCVSVFFFSRYLYTICCRFSRSRA